VKLIFAEHAWSDYLYWQKTDKKTLNRINSLIKAIQRDPFEGLGKPEPLKHALSGYWSRRINDEHRIVYKVREGSLLIAQSRYHYCPRATLVSQHVCV
jgi:toxin YoeB